MKTYLKREQHREFHEIKGHNYAPTSTLTRNIKEGSEGKDYTVTQDYFTDTGSKDCYPPVNKDRYDSGKIMQIGVLTIIRHGKQRQRRQVDTKVAGVDIDASLRRSLPIRYS